MTAGDQATGSGPIESEHFSGGTPNASQYDFADPDSEPADLPDSDGIHDSAITQRATAKTNGKANGKVAGKQAKPAAKAAPAKGAAKTPAKTDDTSADDGGSEAPPVKAGAKNAAKTNGKPAAQVAKRLPVMKTTSKLAVKSKTEPAPAKDELFDGEEDDAVDSQKGEAEGEGEAEVDAHADADDEAGGFTKELLAEAREYGYTDEEAKSFGTSDNLLKSMAAHDRMAAEFGRRQQQTNNGEGEEQTDAQKSEKTMTDPVIQQQEQQRQQEEARRAAETRSRQQPKTTDTNDKPTLEKFKLDRAALLEQGFDEPTVDLLSGINDHYHGQSEKLHKQLEESNQRLSQVTGRFQAEDAARYAESMDTFFGELSAKGDEFRDMYGEGNVSSISLNSPEGKNRLKLLEEMDALQFADRIVGRRSSLAQLQQRAFRSLHGDKLKTIARNEVRKEVDERRNQSVSRPTSRRTKSRDSDSAAGEFANSFFKDRGMEVDEPYPTDI